MVGCGGGQRLLEPWVAAAGGGVEVGQVRVTAAEEVGGRWSRGRW